MNTSDSKSLRDRVSDTVRHLPRSGIRDFFDVVSQMPDAISLGVGEPGFDTPWHIRDAAVFALEKGATSYTSNSGLPRLRQAISGYVEERFGVRYDPSQEILVTVGVSEALDLALRALVNPGDEVLYHEPCYVSYEPVIKLAHGVPVAIETSEATEFRLIADQLERQASPRAKALLLNFPNNPTGADIEAEELRRIADFCVRRDLVVVTDEIYAELTYEGTHPSIAALPGMRNRTILLHGLSKAWAMTGFRIGYSCAPAFLTDAMMTIHQYTMLCAPILSQEAAIEALSNPAKDLREMKDQYRRNRNFIHRSLEEMGLRCVRPRGAFYAFPSIQSTGLKSKDFALRLLEEEKVAVVPGTAFGRCGEGFVRCSFATDLDRIREAMDRMGRLVARLRRRPAKSRSGAAGAGR